MLVRQTGSSSVFRLVHSGPSNVYHAEPAQPINNTDAYFEEKNTALGENKGDVS